VSAQALVLDPIQIVDSALNAPDLPHGERQRALARQQSIQPHQDLDNRNRQLGVLRLTDATIAQSFSKN